MSEMIDKTALVVMSGGQDSTTCLMMAREKYKKVEAICFNYGQKHSIEITCCQNICNRFKIPLQIFETDTISQIGDSALLQGKEQSVNEQHDKDNNLPASFVPGRNLYFLLVASMHAYKNGIDTLITGVSMEDYSGYPDCREKTITALQLAISLGVDRPINIETPLMYMSKSDSILRMTEIIGGMEALSMTHTCYNGESPPCGKCPSCELRAKAFMRASIKDPLIERSKNN